jgi:hypothetical protein
MYNTEGKEEIDDDDDVKGMYILLSGTLAVVTSAVRGTMIFPAVDDDDDDDDDDVVYIRKPILLCGYNPI